MRWVKVRSIVLAAHSSTVICPKQKQFMGLLAEGLAVDSEDNLYLDSNGVIVKVTVRQNLESIHLVVARIGLRLILLDGEVYLDSLEAIEALNLSGEMFESFGFGSLIFSRGVAVDGSDGTVYVSDQAANKVLVFEAIVLPGVSVGVLVVRVRGV